MIHLVIGYAGYEHIKSEDDGAFNAAFFGEGQYVMEIGGQFAASFIDNNTVRIADGDGLMYGRHFRIKPNTYEDASVITGTAGANRIDLICITYKKNEENGTEETYLEVIKGNETTGTPSVPAYTNGNILNGAVLNQMPIYKVNIEGVVLKSVEPLFETIPTYKKLAERYATEFEGRVEEASAGFMLKSGGTFTNQTTYETTNQQPITFDMPNAQIGVTPSVAQVSMLAVRDKNDAIIGKFQVAQHITGVTETVVGATDETGTANLSIGITDTGKKYCNFNGEPIMTDKGGALNGWLHYSSYNALSNTDASVIRQTYVQNSSGTNVSTFQIKMVRK